MAMAVRVLMFAAIREAAGVPEVVVDADRLDVLLDGLRARYGELFTRRLACSTVLLDGTAVHPPATVEVPDGSEVAILPPVSGGARGCLRPVSRSHP